MFWYMHSEMIITVKEINISISLYCYPYVYLSMCMCVGEIKNTWNYFLFVKTKTDKYEIRSKTSL
jgi:hypothetical protein